MALLDRVTTLIRANLNDLVDKAENPEKLLKQLLLDMQNQFMQLKTQVAIAIADGQLLNKKHRENLDAQAEWVRKAELALSKNEEDLARIALERSITYENAATNFLQQMEDQAHQVNSLRDALHHLEGKITETKAKGDLLLAQHRRARLAVQTGVTSLKTFEQDAAFDRLKDKVNGIEALGEGHTIAARELDTDGRLNQLEKTDQVDRMLAELKGRLGARTPEAPTFLKQLPK